MESVAFTGKDALYIELFGTLAPPKAGKTFDVGMLEGTVAQAFPVARNDRIFTVEFDTESCGAYCGNHQLVTIDGLNVKGKWSDMRDARQLEVTAGAP